MSLERLLDKAFKLLKADAGVSPIVGPGILRNCWLGASQVVGGGQLFYKRRGMVVTIPAELKQYVDYRSFRLSLPS